MILQKIKELRDAVPDQAPLIHCITNPISLNSCANLVLSVGARPIMAEHPGEVSEITRTAKALMLNLGNITDVRMESIRISAEEANRQRIPVILDLVGIACSKLRKDFAKKLLAECQFTVLKGNYSEIYALGQEAYKSSGVDADASLTEASIARTAVELARKQNCIILASGRVDIVTDGKQLFYGKNGCSELGRVTGTGCMLGALTACYLSARPDILAAAAACVVFGICGELSVTEKGSGSFAVNLMDHLSTLSGEEIENYAQLEEIKIEEI